MFTDRPISTAKGPSVPDCPRTQECLRLHIAWKVSKYRAFSSPYFSVFGMNMKIFKVNLGIQFEYRKIRPRKNSVFGHFSRSAQVHECPPSALNVLNAFRMPKCLIRCDWKELNFEVELEYWFEKLLRLVIQIWFLWKLYFTIFTRN